MYKYTYPITRNLRLTTTVESDVLLATEADVMAFYDRQVSEDDYDRIIRAFCDDPGFHNSSHRRGHCARYNFPPREQCRYGQFTGYSFYEGIKVIGENHYRIYLGS
jgi:hypothetical protein